MGRQGRLLGPAKSNVAQLRSKARGFKLDARLRALTLVRPSVLIMNFVRNRPRMSEGIFQPERIGRARTREL